MAFSRAASWWVGLCLLAACSGPSSPHAAPPPAAARVRWDPVQASAIDVAEDAVELKTRCTPGAAERCNALDDDCDAAIDESCGYLSGPVQVTVQWDVPADVDLHILDPTGALLTPRHRKVPSGGRLDRFAFGACHESDPPPRLENAFWARFPDPGRYRIGLELTARCQADLPVTATVSLRLGEAPVRTFNVRLDEEGERVPVVSVRLGAAEPSQPAPAP